MEDPPPARPVSGPIRILLILVGWIALGLGILGAFLPILPTTPFVLLAAACFSRSSERLHRWLLSRPGLGPLVVDWEMHGVVRPRVKAVASVTIILVFGTSAALVPLALWHRLLLIGLGAAVLSYILSRPSRPGPRSGR